MLMARGQYNGNGLLLNFFQYAVLSLILHHGNGENFDMKTKLVFD